MATGLLGINPYSSGVNLDLSSKATNMAIQQEQKRQAKREATEKYLMDYEKSINPAGMRHIDAQLYNQKMRDAQENFIKNREAILNPTKYGYEAQATHLANLKDAASIVDESKAQAKLDAENARTVASFHRKGLELDKDSMDRLHHSTNYHIRAKEFLSVNPSDLNVVQPFEEGKFIKDVYNGIKPNEEIVSTIPDAKNPGYANQTFKFTLSPSEKNTIGRRAISMYGNKEGFTNEINNLISSGSYKSLKPEFDQLYPGEKMEMADPHQIAAAYALSLGEIERTKTRQIADKVWEHNQNEAAWQKHFDKESALRRELSNNQINAANANANVDYVNKAMDSWVKPNNVYTINDKTYSVLTPPEDIIKNYRKKEKSKDVISQKNIEYETTPMIIRDPETRRIYKLKPEIDKLTHEPTGKYYPTPEDITEDFHANTTKVLIPSAGKAATNIGLQGGNLKGETYIERKNREAKEAKKNK